MACLNQELFDPYSKGICAWKSNSQFDSRIFFNHNSCISSPNEQCEGILGIYTSRPFQWYPRGHIWCLFAFSTKVLNIQDSRMNATPKVGMHLKIVEFNLLHFPPLVRVCFTPEHIILASCALALHTQSRTRCQGYENKYDQHKKQL